MEKMISHESKNSRLFLEKSKSGSILRAMMEVMKAIVNNNITNKYLMLFFIIWEILQLISLIFYIGEFNQSIQSYLYLSTITIYLLNIYSDILFKIWIFSLITFLIILSIFIILIIVIKFCKNPKNLLLIFFIKFAGIIFFGFKTFLLIPVTGPLANMIFCGNSDCWQGTGIATSLISTIILLFILFFVYLLEIINDSYLISDLPWACSFSSIEFLWQILKMLFACYFFVDSSQNFVLGFICFNIIAFILLLYYNLFHNFYYYKEIEIAYHFRGVMIIYLLFVVIFYQLFNLKVNNLQIFFHLLIAVILTLSAMGYTNYNSNLVFIEGIKYDVPQIQAWKIFYNLLMIIKKFRQNSSNFPLIKSFINIHKETCPFQDCPSKTLPIFNCDLRNKESKLNENNVKGKDVFDQTAISRNSEDESGGFISSDNALSSENIKEINEGLNSFSVYLINNFLQETKNSFFSNIIASTYFDYFKKNYYRGIFLLLKSKKSSLSLHDKFQQFLIISRLDEKYVDSEQEINKELFEISLENYVKFEDERKFFYYYLKQSTLSIFKFCKHLLSMNSDIEELFNYGGEITSNLTILHHHFNSIMNIYPDHIQTKEIFGNFLLQILGNPIRGYELLNSVETLKLSQSKARFVSFSEEKIFSLNTKTAIIVTSGEQYDLGVILKVNEYIKDLLGYDFNDLLGFPTSKIMPNPIAKRHDLYIEKFIQTGERKVINKDLFTFAVHKNGYIVPIVIMVKLMPGSIDGIKFISFINSKLEVIKKKYIKIGYLNLKNEMFFIITDEYGNIISGCNKMIDLFNIPKYYIKEKQVFTSEPFHILKLCEMLNPTKNEKELMEGFDVILRNNHLIKKLDFDLIKEIDAEKLKNEIIEIKCHVILLRQKFSFNVNFDIYCFFIQDKEPSSSMNKLSEESLPKFHEHASNDLIQQENSILERYKSDPKLLNIVRELKSLFLNQRTPKFIFMYTLIAVGFFALFLALGVSNSILEFVKINNFENAISLLKYSKSRLYHQMMIEIYLGLYIKQCTGVASSSPTIEPNNQLIILNYIQNISKCGTDSEFDFENYLKLIYLPEINDPYIGSGISFTTIRSTGKIDSNGNTFMMNSHLLYTKAVKITKGYSCSSLNTPFLLSLFSLNFNIATPLKDSDINAYFLMINIYQNYISISANFTERIIEKIGQFSIEYYNISFIYFFVPKILMYIFLMGLMIFANQVIHNRKRKILNFYSQSPNSEIQDLYQQVTKFYQGITFMNEIESKVIEEFLGMEMEEASSISKQFLEIPSSDKLLKKQNKNPNEDESIEFSNEEIFILKEREKIFSNYNPSKFLLFFLIICAFILTSSLEIAHLVLIHIQKKNINDNANFIDTILDRNYYLQNMQIMLLFSNYFQNLPSSIYSKQFDLNFDLILEIENNITNLLQEFPSNQASVANSLKDLSSNFFCKKILQYNISFPFGKMSSEHCLSFPDQILDEGLTDAIYYYLRFIQNKYYLMIKGIDTFILTNLNDPIMIMINEIIIIVLKYFESLSFTNFFDYLSLVKTQIIILLVSYIILIIILMVIVFSIIISKLKLEFQQIRGMLSVYPTEILENSQKRLKKVNKLFKIFK